MSTKVLSRACGKLDDTGERISERVFTSCTTEGPIQVYVRDGKVVRIRPLVADAKDFKPWTIEAGGRRYTPPKEIPPCPLYPCREEAALF
jgi:anaerobic selenocysteine-containing dehydrogenase